jgi:hypothetical protein
MSWITHSSSPRCSARSTTLHLLREAPEHRHGRSLACISPENIAGTLTGESSPSFSCRPSDLDPTAPNRSLIEPVWANLGCPIQLKSNGPQRRSTRTGTSESQSTACQPHASPEFKSVLKLLYIAETCKIHIFPTIHPKSTNFMYLES